MTALLHRVADLRTQADAMRTALRIGAMSVEDVVAWARTIIVETDHPHWSVCELALCSDRYPPDLNEFLSEVPGSGDPIAASAIVVRLLSDSLWARPDRADQIARSLHDLAVAGDLDASPLRDVAWWAWDALDLADAGVIEQTRADVIAMMHGAFQKAVVP
jgi:hypothetical protein